MLLFWRIRLLRASPVIIVDTESPSRDTLERRCVLSQSAPHPIVMFTDDGGNSSIQAAAIQAGVTAYVVEALAERASAHPASSTGAL